jgi:hypothetical protein
MFVASRGPLSFRRRLKRVPTVTAGDLENRVAEAVQAHRPELAALVRERVSAEVDKLVAELVAAELDARRNGHAVRLCSTCGERPAQSGRRVCGKCRAQADRRRYPSLRLRAEGDAGEEAVV